MGSTLVAGVRCPICEGEEIGLLFNVSYGQMLRCQSCHLAFVYPRPTREELSAYYDQQYVSDYLQSPMHGEEPARDRYETLSQLLDKYASHIFQNEQKQVLDIGCATGHLLAYFHVHGWRTRGLEISPETAAYAQEKLGIDVIVGDLPEVGLPAEAFDLITMYHLIEHLIDPRAYLSECRRILKPRGALFIETPNFDGLGARIQGPKWSHITPPEHLVYFDPWSLLNLVQGVRLKVVYVRTVKARYIESIQGWPPLLKQLGQLAYSIAPYFNLGTTIHVLAIKE